MNPLDLATTPLQGSNLIEASAGTGKTFTIAGLFLRLILEKQLAVESILVVTFTEAATAELRERIRGRLAEAERAFTIGNSEDPLLGPLLDASHDPAADARRLRQALLNFDRAAIHTIHGFCQRILRDHAFESGGPFEQEVLADQEELLDEIANDFWRRHIQDLPPPLIRGLRQDGLSPESLAGQLRNLLAKPYLKVRGGEGDPEAATEQARAYAEALDAARELWKREGDEIRELLLNASGLNKTSYKPAVIAPLLDQLDHAVGQQLPALDDKLQRFAASFMATKVNKGKTAPEHPFFEAWDAAWSGYTGWIQARAELMTRLLRMARDFFETELRRRKEEAGLLAYDDMLLRVHQALAGEAGEQAAKAMANAYQAALIDEFQDTDPLQYAIFNTLFGLDHILFLVGDPKQAIYSFRGADIFAYLTARDHAKGRFTLTTNWRSEAGVVEGCNRLFDQSPTPFLFAEIPFQEARPNREQPVLPLIDPDEDRATLNLWFLPKGERDKPHTKDDARHLIHRHCAAEVARLLQGGQKNEVHLPKRPLRAGDIAILVRTHAQAEEMLEVLRQWGIRGVRGARDSVFETAEAAQLEQVLHAIHAPHQEGLLRGALATPLFGLDADALERLTGDEAGLAQHLRGFTELHQRWRERGFHAMFHHLLEGDGVSQRLLDLEDGERRLTNLRHLGERLHDHHRNEHPSPQGLLKWFSRQRQGAGETDEAELRLESDEHLVQIVTIHKSKGLEYPIVFCPHLWDGRLGDPNGDPIIFHDPEDEYAATLDFGSQAYDQARIQHWKEELAESLRLLYVAVTRAKHRCYLAWGNISGNGASPLGLLLHDELPPTTEKWHNALLNRLAGMDDDTLYARLEALHSAAPGAIAIRRLETTPPHARAIAMAQPALAGNARTAARRVEARQRLTSFTALTRGHGHGDPELPDHDPQPIAGPEAEGIPVSPAGDIMAFPRGAQAGSCLHHLFENIDFRASSAEIATQAERSLERFGFELEWRDVITAMAAEVLATPLDGRQTRLDRVSPRNRLVEMEFHFPWRSAAQRKLWRSIKSHWPEIPAPFADALAGLASAQATAEGFMHGFIDLIFELDGRYYLADYKSNHLGDRLENYRPTQLLTAMAEHHYYLQYLLYTLALHRYLRQRLPDYRYADHFGGVYYLFLRGVRAADGDRQGVYFDKPPEGVIRALEELLDGPVLETSE